MVSGRPMFKYFWYLGNVGIGTQGVTYIDTEPACSMSYQKIIVRYVFYKL